MGCSPAMLGPDEIGDKVVTQLDKILLFARKTYCANNFTCSSKI